MVFFVGCAIALAAGFFDMRVFRKEEAIILSLLVAITAGVGGILLVIFVVAPNLE